MSASDVAGGQTIGSRWSANNDIQHPITHLLVEQVIAHHSAQVRAGGLDQDYVEELWVQLCEGVKLPAIVVFQEKSEAVIGIANGGIAYGGDFYVADGFHRLAAALKGRSAGIKEIAVEVREGGLRDAIEYALGANGQHGKRRSGMDLERGYQIGVAEGFFAEDDAGEVEKILKCSGRWARHLTREAREVARVSRDAKIEALVEKGMTQRDVAKEMDVDQKTVSRVLEAKRKCSVSPQNENKDDKERVTDCSKDSSVKSDYEMKNAMGGQVSGKKVTVRTVEDVHTASEKGSEPLQREPDVRSCDNTGIALDRAKTGVRALTVGDLERFKEWLSAYCRAIEDTPSLIDLAQGGGGVSVVGGS